ncbi:MAG: M23 family metallopeptidase, partial [Deltaproteobacteria bacterium]|nr:M23 family metallopeptidase [Deltaproteobacteria bacterium]
MVNSASDWFCRVVALCGALALAGPVLVGCVGEMGEGGADETSPGGEAEGSGDGSATAQQCAPSSGVTGSGTGPSPEQDVPCDNGSCWDAPSVTLHCGTGTSAEDFGTGKYNVHAYSLETLAGVSVELTVQQTAGPWSPAVLLADSEGAIVHDGEISASSEALQIELLASGKDGVEASLRITSAETRPLVLYVTSWHIVEADYAPSMPTTASYLLSTFADCPPADETCPLPPSSITTFGSGYFTEADSRYPNDPNYSPYKRDSRSSHSGYDLHAPLGTPVLATQSGTIVSASETNAGLCGLSINLAADSGVTFRYCHLDEVFVTAGDVQAGDVIGLNGKTGNAKSPHVHFVYLDAPNVTGAGTASQKSEKVNSYID